MRKLGGLVGLKQVLAIEAAHHVFGREEDVSRLALCLPFSGMTVENLPTAGNVGRDRDIGIELLEAIDVKWRLRRIAGVDRERAFLLGGLDKRRVACFAARLPATSAARTNRDVDMGTFLSRVMLFRIWAARLSRRAINRGTP